MNTISSEMPLSLSVEAHPGRAVTPRKEQAKPLSAPASDRSALGPAELKTLVAKIQDHLSSMNISVTFSTYGEEDDRTAMVVKERETGKIIREIPPEEIQTLHEKMQELLGLIFNDRA